MKCKTGGQNSINLFLVFVADKASRSIRMCCVSFLSRFLRGWLCLQWYCPSHTFVGRNTGWACCPYMLLAQASMRIRLGEWLLIWPKTPSVCTRVKCPQESLAQAGQFLRLGSLAHPLYIILAFSNTVSCCTNFWRLWGGPRGLSEWTSQILRIQIFRGGKWKMTGFQSGKRCWKYQSMESFPLLLIIAYL